MPSSNDLTGLLLAWRQGQSSPSPALEQEIYASLKRMAYSRWRQGGQPQTFSPSELVQEAAVRLLNGSVDWSSRVHFFALAALQMRAVLIDRARARSAEKRGGGASPSPLAEVDADALPGTAGIDEQLLDLDRALCKLAQEDARAARVVELTYFGGLQTPDVALVLGLSRRTVEKSLAYGRAVLHQHLAG
ncbi:ECF-type sigma factor [Aquimonas voraii]|uniref:RNA polymerase sigma factor, TIGR02999 family n=1 Tax=Aquimonas voraii TaxID=265719 RepID=A0A1G6U9K0_9GAMM|nr:ECF-type sigma factor [Aquimonas voraii]SDD37961.1 RNA polymerase sigma factor, TIGR02999 family [Aquimonas voraii]